MWKKGFKADNLISGFSEAGICPFNRKALEKYINRLPDVIRYGSSTRCLSQNPPPQDSSTVVSSRALTLPTAITRGLVMQEKASKFQNKSTGDNRAPIMQMESSPTTMESSRLAQNSKEILLFIYIEAKKNLQVL